jgi:hypothetical protein
MENNQTERIADGSKMMCSIDWLIRQMSLEDVCKYSNELAEAKEIHKQEIIDAYIEGFSATDYNVDSLEYYNETFNPQNNG